MSIKLVGWALGLALMMVPLQRCGDRTPVAPVQPEIPAAEEPAEPPATVPPSAEETATEEPSAPLPPGCEYLDSGSAFNSDAISTFVVGGRQSVRGCRSYQVALLSGGGFFCGGTLIDDNWVLTAAHCIDGQSPRRVSVRINGYQLSANDGTVIPVSQIIAHPSFNIRRPSSGSDIALLQLSQPAPADAIRAIVASPATEAIIAPQGARLTLSGWGQSGARDQRPQDVLLEAELTVNDPCTRQRGDLCAGNRATGGCYGDSGGPLVGRLGGQFYSIGTVSRAGSSTRPCASETVFTRSAGFADWIQQNSGIVAR